jgi:hypothetical protein
MMRLRDEIVSSRHARVVLRGDLIRQTNERCGRVSALCAGFARDRAGAHRAWFGPMLFEGQMAERPPQRKLAEEPRAKAPAQKQPPAVPKAEPRRRASAKPVVTPAARMTAAHSPQGRKPPIKKAKKH